MTQLTTELPVGDEAAEAPDVTHGVPPWVDRAVVVLVVLMGAFGVAERLWVFSHLPILSDEAVVGLMARQIQHGHFTTFYWAQNYGGLEPYLVAAVTKVVPGPIGLNLTPVLLCALSSVVVGLLVSELTHDKRAALAAGALVWVWPYGVVWNSTRELGFHFVSLFLGLTMIYLAVRLGRGHRGTLTCLGLGLSAGAGFWSSPEIFYFVVSAGLVLVATWRRWAGVRTVAVVAGAALVGALPWLYANVHSGFASLSLAAAPHGAPSTYRERLSIFFHQFLPLELGLKDLYTGQWVGGASLGKVLFVLACLVLVGTIVAACWLSLRRGKGPELGALAAGVVAFPFLLAANPATNYWLEDRYGVDFSFLLVALVFATVTTALYELAGPARHRARHRAGDRRAPLWVAGLASAALVGGAVLTLVHGGALLAGPGVTPATGFGAVFSSLPNPNAGMEDAVGAMRAAGIRTAYADYWTAYSLDFLDPGLSVSPTPLDPVRSSSLAEAVARSPHPAWLFSAPSHLDGANRAFGDEQGPGAYSELAFTDYLDHQGVPYRVVHLGILDAVIPDRTVHPPPIPLP